MPDLWAVVQRNARMVARDPVGVRQVHVVAHDPVARLVVHPPGRALEPLEHDVLVEARDHARRQLEPARVDRVEVLPGDVVLPRHDLGQSLDLDEPERGGELVHAEVEPVDFVVGLAVVAEGAGMLEELGPVRDEHAALAGRDRLGRVQRVDAGVTVGAGLAPIPSAPWAWAQSSIRKIPLGAVVGDLLDLERDMAADVDQHRGPRLVLLEPWPRSRQRTCTGPRGCSRRTRRARPRHGRERRGHERVRGTQHRLPRDPRKVKRRQRAAGPARHSHRRDPVLLGPGGLEARHHGRLGPPVGVDDLIDQRVEPSAIAGIEADREPGEVGAAALARGIGNAFLRGNGGHRRFARPKRRIARCSAGRSGNPCAQLANPLRSWCAPARLSDRQDGTDFLAFEFSHYQFQCLRGARVGSLRRVEVRIVQEDHVPWAHSSAVVRAAILAGVVNRRQSLPQRDHRSGLSPRARAAARPAELYRP